MCTGSPGEQQLYHSISTVATLLLQIGEVAKQFPKTLSRPPSADSEAMGTNTSSGTPDTRSSTLHEPAADSPRVIPKTKAVKKSPQLTPAETDPLRFLQGGDSDSDNDSIIRDLEQSHAPKLSPRKESHAQPDPDWSINFEQFLASMLTEPHLVAIFEKENDILSSIEVYRNRRLKPTVDDDTASPSGRR